MSAALVLAAAATACSGDDSGGSDAKKYTVPESLCGVAVDPTLVKALLPGGDALTSAAAKPNGGTQRCDVSVDGKEALRLSQTWWASSESATTVAKGYAGLDDGTASDDGRFVHAGTGGVGEAASCTSSKHPEQKLYAVVQVLASGIDDEDGVEKLVTDYTKGVEQSAACG
ncbi:hypothetical protein AB0J38_42870 [Streptomyces sp. NPDC050095]|uniref:hypothetical protein n=1 Tax=unclassified Streptomyces TaxID=2593676 RepID=UPI00341BF4CD